MIQRYSCAGITVTCISYNRIMHNKHTKTLTGR